MRNTNSPLPLSLLALLLAFSACQPLSRSAQNPRFPTALNAQSNPTNRSNLTNLRKNAITASFVRAYLPTVAENEPLARADSQGPAQELLNLINSAQASLDGAFYDIREPMMVQALIRAKQRGVNVRLVTESDNMGEEANPCPQPNGQMRKVLQDLLNAGIPIVSDQRSGLMHHKFMVADRMRVWMGSTNLTSSSLFRHNNTALTLVSAPLAANYTYEFEQLFMARNFGPPRAVINPIVDLQGAAVKTYFSPRGGGQEAVVAALQNARKSIHFLTFSLTDPQLGEILSGKQQAGLDVRGVFDRCLSKGQYSLYWPLKRTGMQVFIDGNEALLHNKVMIIDGETVITGSYNFSKNAEKSNNESFVIVEKAPELGAAFESEYNRLQYAAQHNNPPDGQCPGTAPPSPPPCQPADPVDPVDIEIPDFD